MGVLRRLVPATIRGQMTVVIIVAVVTVVTLGDIIEPRMEAYFPAADLDQIVDRATLIARFLAEASPGEQAFLLDRASHMGLDLILAEPSALENMISASPEPPVLDRWAEWFFPTDAPLPTGGRWIVIEGRRALAMPIDAQSILVARNLPDVLATEDFVSPLTYYVLSFLTLLFLFSFYSARKLARPIDRIVTELDRTDGVAEDRHIEERGTVEVVKLARALNAMRARIRSMVDMRMRMLRSVSHDLRTPLTRLRLRAERLEDEALRQSMTADIDGIDALVNETLDYLRVDAQGEAEERVDVSSLLQTIQADFADVGFDVRYEGPDRLVAFCRPNALARAVANLCDNALKFGLRATIFLVRAPGAIRIDVADEGPGIPAEKRALVLEPFFKLDAARTAGGAPGFGLGLSIVADIARAHGGHVEFHDREPRGLIVRLVLPA